MKRVLLKRIVAIAVIGNIFEWYDFIVYASLAPVLSKVFFSSNDKLTSLLLTFTVFALGFLVRTYGGIVVGGYSGMSGRIRMGSVGE